MPHSLGKCHWARAELPPQSMGLQVRALWHWAVSSPGCVVQYSPHFPGPFPTSSSCPLPCPGVCIIGQWNGSPYTPGKQTVFAYSKKMFSKMYGRRRAGAIDASLHGSCSSPSLGMQLGCRGSSWSQGQYLQSAGFPCQVWPRPACGSLNWTLVYYCNEDPFSNVFPSPHVVELLFFSLDFFFFAYEMFWINMQLKWLVTDCVHFQLNEK